MKLRMILLFLFLLIIFSCSTGPDIIRRMIPVIDNKMDLKSNISTAEKDGVRVTVEYLDKKKLLKIARENNPYVDDTGAILTAFKIVVENKRDAKISFEPEKSVLLDGIGNQFNALTYDTFRELYPSTVYQQYEYSFIFNRYYVESYPSDDYYKRKKAAKSLFKGGVIYPNVKVEGILPFQRVSEYARNITLILPDIILYNSTTDTNNGVFKEQKRIEFKFEFVQKIIRLK